MDREIHHISEQISKYLRCELTEEEEQRFREWLDVSEENRQLLAQFEGDSAIKDIQYLSELDDGDAWDIQRSKRRQLMWKRLRLYSGWAAALVAAFLLISWLFEGTSRNGSKEPEHKIAIQHTDDVAPGSAKATLVLSDGTGVSLGDGAPQMLTERNGATIIGGESVISYNSQQIPDGHLLFNKLIVPKAGMFSLTLSDGTKVWLNALSELEFPVTFSADERQVKLRGEAFFEVARDAKRPFRVWVDNTIIEVLGTQFNVNTYGGMTATLMEGAINVAHGSASRILKPGQQAHVTDQITVSQADLERTAAWKNGEFLFKSDRITDIMEELSRWYDITVVYRGDIPKDAGFTGSVSRNVNLSQVLDLVSFASGASFVIRNREVTVTF